MDMELLMKMSKEIEKISKEAKDKLQITSLSKDLTDEQKSKLDELVGIFSELNIAIENKDVSKMQKLLSDANKISI